MELTIAGPIHDQALLQIDGQFALLVVIPGAGGAHLLDCFAGFVGVLDDCLGKIFRIIPFHQFPFSL